AAIAAVAAGGEVVVLDSGGYGAVTITQAVTIEAPAGIYAGIHVTSGDAITINAGVFDVVTVRGLTLNGGSNSGITVSSVGTLVVESCLISGFQMDGISVPSGGVSVIVKDTDVRTCAQGFGIRNSSGTVTAVIDRSHLDANSIGYFSIN